MYTQINSVSELDWDRQKTPGHFDNLSIMVRIGVLKGPGAASVSTGDWHIISI